MTSSQSSWSHSPVVLYDTLLRDGSQMEGISFSLDDKVAIAHRLDALGVHYVEGGFPGSNENGGRLIRERVHFQVIRCIATRAVPRGGCYGILVSCDAR